MCFKLKEEKKNDNINPLYLLSILSTKPNQITYSPIFPRGFPSIEKANCNSEINEDGKT